MIEQLVAILADDPFSSRNNFECAIEYEKLGQLFSAITFYLRTAEYANLDDEAEKLMAYNSLLKLARCLDPQQERNYSVSNCILQAIALMPERPEAYFLMSQYHERLSNWQECYTFAEMGLAFWWDKNHLKADVGFHDEYVLIFEKAISAYWIGRQDESIHLLRQLEQLSIAPEYASAVKSNLERINAGV